MAPKEHALSIILDAHFDDMVFGKRPAGQQGRPIAAHEDSYWMFGHFVPNFLNISFGDDVAVTHHYNGIGDEIHFMENMTRDDYELALSCKLFKQSDGFRARHRIQTVQRFIQHNDCRMMSNGKS